MQNYQVPRVKDKRGFDLISDVLPFGRLWYASRTQLRTLSDTPSSTAVHMML
jgi:hypothetical protein